MGETNAVCETEPGCLCGDGGDEEECGCVEEEGKGVCVSCGQPMFAVDADTGEPIEP